ESYKTSGLHVCSFLSSMQIHKLLRQFLELADLPLEFVSGTWTFEAAVDRLNTMIPVHEDGRRIGEKVVELVVNLFLHIFIVYAAAEQERISKPEAIFVELKILLGRSSIIRDLKRQADNLQAVFTESLLQPL